MNHVDSEFVNLISPKLSKFKKVKADLYTFRCPLCGDSKKHKNKTRGYIFCHSKTRDLIFKCHNCGASMAFGNFLKKMDTVLYDRYVTEKFKKGITGRSSNTPNPVFNFPKPKFEPKLDLPKASENKIAKQYLESRNINPNKFYYTDSFKKWVNTLVTKFDDVTYDEPRIIIPLIYENQLIGIQGRSLGPNSIKYITIMLDENAPKIYGLDKIDDQKPIYIIEGRFDSTFVENSVAMCGSDLDIGSFGWSDHIWVFDNEPRNNEINSRVSKVIDRGDKVVIWPQNIEEKDINDMVLGGHDVKSVLESNTFSGLKAKLKFNSWKKI